MEKYHLHDKKVNKKNPKGGLKKKKGTKNIKWFCRAVLPKNGEKKKLHA